MGNAGTAEALIKESRFQDEICDVVSGVGRGMQVPRSTLTYP